MSFDKFVKDVTGIVRMGIDAAGKGINFGLDAIDAGAEMISGPVSEKIRIDEIDCEIKTIYLEVGEKAIKRFGVFSVFTEEAKRVKELEEEKAKLDKKILKYENKIRCCACGVAISDKFGYCPNCGAEIISEDNDESDE